MRLPLERWGAVTDLRSGDRLDGPALARSAAHRHGALSRLGVAPGDIVLIAHGGTPDFFADLAAVWSAGACAACVSPSLTASEMANLASFTEARAVLVSATAREAAATEGLPVPVLDAHEDGGTGDDGGAVTGSLDDPALLLFTSGTTGEPKGVVHSFRSVLARVALNAAHIGEGPLARTLCVLPTHFGHGLIGNCLTPLFAGTELLLAPGTGIAAARTLADTLTQHAITLMSSVPALWALATRMPPPAAATLCHVGVGSAPLSAELWRAIAEWTGTDNVVNMYGITETANWAAGASARDRAPEDGLVGRTWGGNAAVLREDGSVAAGGEGEILLQTPSLMSGYFARPDLSAEALRSGWYHTGDTGRIDDSGAIRLIGRRKNEINRAGTKVQPEEVDLLLERHAGVVEACTFGVPDAVGGEIVGVAVRLADAASADAETLRAWCRERIRAESVPERWFVVSEIPKTDRGKINRDRVRDHCLSKAPQR